MQLQHIISAEQFDRGFLDTLFREARYMEKVVRDGGSKCLTQKLMATFFYEPSTRTRLSFEAAMHRLGGRVMSTDHAKVFSSVAKGEDIRDSIRTLSAYADVIVLRSSEIGMAAKAAEVSAVPLINAGDGAGEHPTQALLDAYTIHRECYGIDGKTIALVGDLHNGRTVRSLVKLAALYRPERFLFVAPEAVRMRTDIREYLQDRGIPFQDVEDFGAALRAADVVYMTRLQKERFGDRIAEYEACRGRYVLDAVKMATHLRDKAIVMHPLPRNEELPEEVDDDRRAAHFRQVRNGLHVRMALLRMLLRRKD